MSTRILDKVKVFIKEEFEKKLPKEYTYHDYNHTLNVTAAAEELSNLAKLDADQKEILILAALFHDIGFLIDPDDHESHSIKIAKKFLSEQDYSEEKVKEVSKCINATRLNSDPENLLCKFIKDADLSGLSKANYPVINEGLRKELKFRGVSDLSLEEWRKQNIIFFNNHYYYTNEANQLFNSGKLKNLSLLNMSNLKPPAKKKTKKKKLLTIGSSKSAQTQFKTALRNHIDLSSIADNKANIMLSVNAIIITVALPLLINRIASHEKLLIPTIILALVCLVSMIFATLSTRPIASKGLTTKEEIVNKKSNLFFFGNYYKMTFENYEDYISTVVSNDELLDNSITRDLFFLGKSLGKKFEYLRWCYNFFMYGIAAAVLSFFVVNLM